LTPHEGEFFTFLPTLNNPVLPILNVFGVQYSG
jgi:hypothetical protein